MTRLEQDDIRFKNRAGLAGTKVDDAPTDVGSAVPPSEVSRIATTPRVASIAKAVDLDVAYERYKQGKGFGRSDLFKVMIDEIKDMKVRLGSVDEAKVGELEGRMSALERTIGNALTGASEKRGPGRPKREETEANG